MLPNHSFFKSELLLEGDLDGDFVDLEGDFEALPDFLGSFLDFDFDSSLPRLFLFFSLFSFLACLYVSAISFLRTTLIFDLILLLVSSRLAFLAFA